MGLGFHLIRYSCAYYGDFCALSYHRHQIGNMNHSWKRICALVRLFSWYAWNAIYLIWFKRYLFHIPLYFNHLLVRKTRKKKHFPYTNIYKKIRLRGYILMRFRPVNLCSDWFRDKHWLLKALGTDCAKFEMHRFQQDWLHKSDPNANRS